MEIKIWTQHFFLFRCIYFFIAQLKKSQLLFDTLFRLSELSSGGTVYYFMKSQLIRRLLQCQHNACGDKKAWPIAVHITKVVTAGAAGPLAVGPVGAVSDYLQELLPWLHGAGCGLAALRLLLKKTRNSLDVRLKSRAHHRKGILFNLKMNKPNGVTILSSVKT